MKVAGITEQKRSSRARSIRFAQERIEDTTHYPSKHAKARLPKKRMPK